MTNATHLFASALELAILRSMQVDMTIRRSSPLHAAAGGGVFLRRSLDWPSRQALAIQLADWFARRPERGSNVTERLLA
jgi:hypothetical protein